MVSVIMLRSNLTVARIAYFAITSTTTITVAAVVTFVEATAAAVSVNVAVVAFLIITTPMNLDITIGTSGQHSGACGHVASSGDGSGGSGDKSVADDGVAAVEIVLDGEKFYLLHQLLVGSALLVQTVP